MERVIQALQEVCGVVVAVGWSVGVPPPPTPPSPSPLPQGANALLESPTGTGKTLCLLCAILAWRKAGGAGATSAGDAAPAAAGPGSWARQHADALAAGATPPSIIYASRTHSQLKQVMGELKRTAYAPRAVVLGSRAQLCANPAVAALPAAACAQACAAAVKSGSCTFHGRTDPFLRESPDAHSTPLDVEDLGALARSRGACPFYVARGLAPTADIVFAPYNYLVDPRARAGLRGINWRGAIVVFDEAHNLESVCADAASFELTGPLLAAAIDDAGAAARSASRRLDVGGCGGVVAGAAAPGRAQRRDPAPAAADPAARARDLSLLGGVLTALEAAIGAAAGDLPRPAAVPAPQPGAAPSRRDAAPPHQPAKGRTSPAQALFDILASVGVTAATLPTLARALDDGAELLAEDAAARGAGDRAGTRAAGGALATLADALRLAFESTEPPLRGGPPPTDSYRVHLRWEPSTRPGRPATPTLAYWCFSAGVALRSLAGLGARSLLLTSGTLAPLDSLAAELGLPFPVTLENPHVVPDEHVWAAVLGTGPGRVPLNSSFRSRDSDAYKADLGAAIVSVAAVTPGGLLVFFPSYGALHAAVAAWKRARAPAPLAPRAGATLWDALTWAKPVLVEPRDSASFATVAADYARGVAAPGGRGAALLAVCRGKASEGLDFADASARAVIVTGVPYAAMGDPRVAIKRAVLDDAARAPPKRPAPGSAPAPPPTPPLTGEAWYVQQAARAVNQAIGRVIRHVDDYGAILLADERFAERRARDQVSAWVRRLVTTPADFASARGSLVDFFGVRAGAGRAGGRPRAGAGAPTAAGDRRPASLVDLAPGAPVSARVDISGLAGMVGAGGGCGGDRARPPPPLAGLLGSLAGRPRAPIPPATAAAVRGTRVADAADALLAAGGSVVPAPRAAPRAAAGAPPPPAPRSIAPLFPRALPKPGPPSRPVVEVVGPRPEVAAPATTALAAPLALCQTQPEGAPGTAAAPRRPAPGSQNAPRPTRATTAPAPKPDAKAQMDALKASLPPADYGAILGALRAFRPGGAAAGDAGALLAAVLPTLARPDRLPLLRGFRRFVGAAHAPRVDAAVAAVEREAGGGGRGVPALAPSGGRNPFFGAAPAARRPPAVVRSLPSAPRGRGGRGAPLPGRGAVSRGGVPGPAGSVVRPGGLTNPLARPGPTVDMRAGRGRHLGTLPRAALPGLAGAGPRRDAPRGPGRQAARMLDALAKQQSRGGGAPQPGALP